MQKANRFFFDSTQLFVTIGIFAAGLINYGADYIDTWGWRLSLGLAAVPAVIVIIGGIILPESPNSLLERGHFEKGRKVREIKSINPRPLGS